MFKGEKGFRSILPGRHLQQHAPAALPYEVLPQIQRDTKRNSFYRSLLS